MIDTHATGALPGVVISAVAHEGLRVTVNGKPAHLAVVEDETGAIVAEGEEVATEAEAVAVNSYLAYLQCEGHVRTLSEPIKPTTKAKP